MKASVSDHPWSEEALFSKALLYVGRMESVTPDDWEFGFWSALALELLARSALAHISPVLLADDGTWRNLTYAMGQAPTGKKFSPTSVGTGDVLNRLFELVPDFTEELRGFGAKHVGRRNAELHSGETPFVELGTAEWLPGFYAASKVLLESTGKSLSNLFDDADAAEEMVQSLADAAAKAVAQDVKAHTKVWENKTDEDREAATAQAVTWATRHSGHRVECPACSCPALVRGSASGAITTSVADDLVEERQTMMPTSFECISCSLKISGLSRLAACGLGDAFTATSSYAAAEFFGLHTEDELEEARAEYPLEEDFNE